MQKPKRELLRYARERIKEYKAANGGIAAITVIISYRD